MQTPGSFCRGKGQMENDRDLVFDLKLQIQQLQDKVKFLAGGTDAEQLTEVLMEKEEECRCKDKTITELQHHSQSLKDRLDKSETDRRAIKDYAETQADLRRGLEIRVSDLEADKSQLHTDLRIAKDKHEALESEKSKVEKLLTSCQTKLDGTTAQLTRSEAQVQELEEIARSHEKSIEELVVRKKDIAARARAMKASLEQLLSEEKTRSAALDGQLQACNSEMTDLKAQLYEKSKYISENNARETALAQKNGELQVKLVALGEENTKLQDTIMAMANEKKELDLVHVESQHRAAQYEEQIKSLKREMDRLRAAKDNEILAITKHSQAREALWKDRIKRQDVEFEGRMKEVQEMCLMAREEADMVEVELGCQLQEREGMIGELKTEVNRLMEQVLDLEHKIAEMEEYKQSELLVEQRWRVKVHQEMNDLRKELAEQRKQGSELARLKQENDALKEKISRQDAYLRRKMLKDKQVKTSGPGATGLFPAAAAAATDAVDLPPEPPASRAPLDTNHHHPHFTHPPIPPHAAADVSQGLAMAAAGGLFKSSLGDKENCRQQTPTFVRKQISGTPTSELTASQPKQPTTGGTPFGSMTKSSPFLNKLRDTSPAMRSRTPTSRVPPTTSAPGSAYYLKASSASKKTKTFNAPPRSSTPLTTRNSWK